MDLDSLMKSYQFMLKEDGIIFASHSQYLGYGADHFSGKDKFEHGYNHLILNKKDYKKFLDSYGNLGFPDYENDGRFWIYNNILNDLSFYDFMRLYDKYFQKTYLGIKVDPRTVEFRNKFHGLYNKILANPKSSKEEELFIKGLQVILKQKN